MSMLNNSIHEIAQGRGLVWGPTLQLRWFRPSRGTDADLILQQLWISNAGETEWRELPTEFAD